MLVLVRDRSVGGKKKPKTTTPHAVVELVAGAIICACIRAWLAFVFEVLKVFCKHCRLPSAKCDSA